MKTWQLFETLKVIYIILSVFCTEMFVYQLLMTFGIVARKIKMPVQTPNDKLNRFAIIISARNENNVIAHLIDSLLQQDYPRELFDVYVIADNCTDDTAQVSRDAGAIVYERFNDKLRGKGAALNWFFKLMSREMLEKYDGFCVFDADNLADGGYLRAMNAHINAGEMLIQGNRMIKNPHDSWISGCYAIYFRCILELFMRSRLALNLTGSVGGTGFAFSAELIHKHGWNTYTLTEDIEFSIQQILRGTPVGPAYDAIFYDEQPVTFRASIRQRYRWTLGTLQCMKLYFNDFIQRLFSRNIEFKQRVMCFDMIVFLLAGPCTALIALNAVIGKAILILGTVPWYSILFLEVRSLVFAYALMLVTGLISCWLCRIKLRGMTKALLGWPIFLFSWMYINFIALFYRKVEWKPIAHNDTISLSEQKARLANTTTRK